ncbi:MAG: hypothetical protein ABI619_11180 [Betaproteobacteria bacterium]
MLSLFLTSGRLLHGALAPPMIIPQKMRIAVGNVAFGLSLVFLGWLPLGILHVMPFVFALSGETSLRVHAAAAVGCLMVAAWGFWDD